MMKKRPSRPRSMAMAGEHEKAGLKARLMVYQESEGPASVVSEKIGTG